SSLKPKATTISTAFGTLPLPADKQLCDMVGNVWQWIQDKYQTSYANTPTDGSASEGAGEGRVVRGGSYRSLNTDSVRADIRDLDNPADQDDNTGFRLVRVSR
ncbi:MAG: SUMF1/EgtB/PvdO family nonheme iron enzyme, partial [Elusimicrobiota bacterium]